MFIFCEKFFLEKWPRGPPGGHWNYYQIWSKSSSFNISINIVMFSVKLFKNFCFNSIFKTKKNYCKILKIRGDISDFVRNFGHFSRIFQTFLKNSIFFEIRKISFLCKKLGFIQNSTSRACVFPLHEYTKIVIYNWSKMNFWGKFLQNNLCENDNAHSPYPVRVKKWKRDLKLMKNKFKGKKVFRKNFEKIWKISKSNFCVPGALLLTLNHAGVLRRELLQSLMLLMCNVQKMLRILPKL